MSDFQNYLEEMLKDIYLNGTEEKKTKLEYSVNDEIRKLIIHARTEAGLTQKQLSEKTGLSQANISRIESGQAMPNLGTLKKIADSVGKKLVISFEDFEGENLDGDLY